MHTRFINPVELTTPTNYSHVVVTPAGRSVWVSGQIAFDSQGQVVGQGDLGAQARKVFENLAAALRAVDASFRDVVKINTYVVDLTPEKAGVVRAVRAEFMPDGHKPASTMVGVTSLVHPDLLVEIEVVAHLPERR